MIQLITLPFPTDALEPIIGQQTIEIHHGKHHATYVTNLNKILEAYPEMSDWSVEKILLNLDKFPEAQRQAVINNAGQVYNHDMYWQSMQGGEQKFELSPELGQKIDAFESYENFQKLWTEAGLTQFGSGWVWLSVDSKGDLVISKSSNADSPLLHGLKPILTMDVWEHAYYLDFQNRRADYIAKFFDLINWKEVSRKYAEAIS
jgi:superoxide dismutase, Fe-Mn family